MKFFRIELLAIFKNKIKKIKNKKTIYLFFVCSNCCRSKKCPLLCYLSKMIVRNPLMTRDSGVVLETNLFVSLFDTPLLLVCLRYYQGHYLFAHFHELLSEYKFLVSRSHLRDLIIVQLKRLYFAIEKCREMQLKMQRFATHLIPFRQCVGQSIALAMKRDDM
ncbi:hypothetical protein, partial [Enterococcus cecorum]|uniref:hypothetical protein n=1 Tax=Enterococcus cecorum TaxID=44008 RepID=UPI001FAE2A55